MEKIEHTNCQQSIWKYEQGWKSEDKLNKTEKR